MGQKYAAYNSAGAIVAFYDGVDSPLPPGVTAIEITDAEWLTCIDNPGWTVAGGSLVEPPALTAAQIAAQSLIQSALAALNEGLSITSTATPALNATYAVNQLSQMDIIAIETSLSAGKGFPGGATAFNYPDITGALHAFTESNFSDLAAAVRDFVYGCKAVVAGQSTTLPPSNVTIA